MSPSESEKKGLSPQELAWDLLHFRIRFIKAYREAQGLHDEIAVKGMAIAVAVDSLRKENHFLPGSEEERQVLAEAHRLNPGFY